MKTEEIKNANPIQPFRLFESLSDTVLEDILTHSVQVQCKKKAVIFMQNDPPIYAYFLLEGEIKLGRFTSSGKEIIRKFVQPGEEFGLMALTREEYYGEFAKTISKDAKILKLEREFLFDLMEQEPQLVQNFNAMLSARLKIQERMHESVIEKNTRERVLDFLIECALKRGKYIGAEIGMSFNYTHFDIAAYTVSSRQTVTTVLSELRKHNLIFLQRKKLLIRSLNRLIDYKKNFK